MNGTISEGKLDTYSIELKEDGSVVPESREEPLQLWIVAAIVTIAGVAVALLVYFTKFEKTTERTRDLR